MSSFTSLGLTPEQAIELVSHESIFAAQREGGAVEGLFDASDREEGDDVIIWWNDLEKDQMYAPWSDNIQIVSVQEELNFPSRAHAKVRSYFVLCTPENSIVSRRISSTSSPFLISRTRTPLDSSRHPS